jgi:hypothetical protein
VKYLDEINKTTDRSQRCWWDKKRPQKSQTLELVLATRRWRLPAAKRFHVDGKLEAWNVLVAFLS